MPLEGNISSTTPAAPASNQNVTWQKDSSGNLSAYVPTPILPVTIAAATSKWLNSYTSTTGDFTASQPNFTDLLGSIALGQTPLTTAGDLLYANGTPALARLAIGGTGNVLTVVGGEPVWAAPSGGGGSLSQKTAQVVVVGTAAPSEIGPDTVTGTNYYGAQGPILANAQQNAATYHSSSANSFAGVNGNTSGGSAPWQFLNELTFYCSYYMTATTDRRDWIGLFDTAITTTALFASDTIHSNEYMAFRFSTAASDSDWQCVVCDGSTQNIVSSGIAVDTKSHAFNIVMTDGVNVKFYIDGSLVATISSNIPATRRLAYYIAGTACIASSSYFNFSAVTVTSKA